MSAVQSALCCVAGGVICWWSCQRDFLCTSHYMSEAYAWFGTAYFFYDIWSMYYVWGKDTSRTLPADITNRIKLFLQSHPLIVGHHLFIGTIGFLIIVVSCCCFLIIGVHVHFILFNILYFLLYTCA